MRRFQFSVVVLALAVAACVGDSDPSPAPPTVPRVVVPLGAGEVAAYKQDLSQLFAKRTALLRQSVGGGVVADTAGHTNVVLVRVDGAGGLSTTCADNEA